MTFPRLPTPTTSPYHANSASAPPPPDELIDAVAGWGQWRNQQPPPLEVWRHRCPEMRVARCVSGNLCSAPPRNSSSSSRRRQPVFRTLNPRLMPRFPFFIFLFSSFFHTSACSVDFSSQGLAGCISEKWNVPWHVNANWSKREIEKKSYN